MSCINTFSVKNKLTKMQFKREFFRKAIHASSALTVVFARINLTATIYILSAAALLYILAETARIFSKKRLPLPLRKITMFAARDKERESAVLGPVTLTLGIVAALALYPPVSASAAIFALAFGDGAASLVGRSIGKTRPAFLMGKSVEGSAACFAAVFASALLITRSPLCALLMAAVSTAIEALPLKNFDNIAIPLAAGLIAYLFGF